MELDTHRILLWGRRSLALNIKDPRGRDIALAVAERSDVLVEGFRPGVAERLGWDHSPC